MKKHYDIIRFWVDSWGFYAIMEGYIYFYGHVAQLVEQRPEEPRVAGSSPAVTTRTPMD